MTTYSELVDELTQHILTGTGPRTRIAICREIKSTFPDRSLVYAFLPEWDVVAFHGMFEQERRLLVEQGIVTATPEDKRRMALDAKAREEGERHNEKLMRTIRGQETANADVAVIYPDSILSRR